MTETAETPANHQDSDVSGPNTLNDMIAELDELRDRKRELSSEYKELDERYKALEAEVINTLDNQGVEMTRTGRASASISRQVFPSVVDWEQVQAYIAEHDAQYLYQRRLAAGACQELWEGGENIPGVEQAEKRQINLRKNR